MDLQNLETYSVLELEQIYQEQKAFYTAEELDQISRIIQKKCSIHKTGNKTDMVYCMVMLILTVAGFFLPVIRMILLLFDLWIICCKFSPAFLGCISRETICAMVSLQFPMIGLVMGIYFKMKQHYFSKYCFNAVICSLLLGLLLLTGGFQF
ncbi:MAG: hypothetical protein K2J71_10540 [Oscillospiraceae bacterium]|nr:hypothetical protein [Oscillospiraceae bacterium]